MIKTIRSMIETRRRRVALWREVEERAEMSIRARPLIAAAADAACMADTTRTPRPVIRIGPDHPGLEFVKLIARGADLRLVGLSVEIAPELGARHEFYIP